MTIRFEEEWGAVGVVRAAELPLGELPEGLRIALERLLAAGSPDEPGLRDAGTIRVEAEGRSVRLRPWDVPPDASALLAFLRAAAKPIG